MKEIKAFKCDHCGKLYQRKHFCGWHENMCFKNPKNRRPCLNCHNLFKKTVNTHIDYPDGSEGERMVSCFFCKKKETFLYTPQNEMKHNFYDFGDIANEPMPVACDDFRSVFYVDKSLL